MPEGFLGLLFEVGGGINLAAGTDEAVAGEELVAEPRDAGWLGWFAVLGGFAIDGIEPDAHLGQLGGDGVQVHAEGVAVGDIHPDLLECGGVLIVRDAAAQLGLLALQIRLGELIDGLVDERGAAHGGLADGEAQDFVGGLALEQFLERILHKAAGEHLRSVVAGALLAIAPSKAVDKCVSRVLPHFLTTGLVKIVDDLGGLVVPDAAGWNKPRTVQIVAAHGDIACLLGLDTLVFRFFIRVRGFLVVLAGGLGFLLRLGFHLKEVLRGEEATIGEQGLVNRAELVDRQELVAHAAFAFAFAQGHSANHLLPDVVRKNNMVQKRRGVLLEEAAVERGEAEDFLLRSGDQLAVQAGSAALAHKTEELAQGGVEVVALAGLGGVERDEFEVAQGLQAVALRVDVAFLDGHIPKLWTGLDVEEEHEPIDEPEALQAEVGRVHGVFARVETLFALLRLFAELGHGFVAEEFDGGTERVFEVLADSEGVLVGIRIQAFEKALPLTGSKALAVQEGGGGLQCVGFLAVEDFRPVEAEEAVVRPFVAVDQKPLGGTNEKHMARRLLGTEDRVRKNLRPRKPRQRGRNIKPTEMDGSQAVLQNIQFLIGHGIKSGNNQKSCGTVACLANTPDRQGHAGLDCQK